ncbi:MAG: hypothetical protein BGO67_10220 [Alphaproteobacteria bacterium 41-28]|nr:MAG: hypothetical protein BGO67_10220 [Alphaproteobacteria bacterium 41-28]
MTIISGKQNYELNSIGEIKEFFKNNLIPTYYVSLTKVNLLNIDKWVKKFKYITLDDELYSKKLKAHKLDLNHNLFANIILSDPILIEEIKSSIIKPSFVFLKYNASTEALLKKHDFQLLNPPYNLYEQIDSKIDILETIEKLGIPSVPYHIAEINDHSDIDNIKKKFGNRLVIQSPLGSSGEGTYFIRSEQDIIKYKDEIFNNGPMRIMKEISCKPYGIDACATRCGTILGPVLTDLVGDRNLTDYEGGSCGNEIFKDVIDEENKYKILEYTKKIGNYLYNQKNFRGSFTVDYLLDRMTNKVFFGEINPRISSAGFLTNEVTGIAGIPMFLFHLLEYFDVNFKISVDEFNLNIQHISNKNYFSQLILTHTDDQVGSTKNVKSGIWKLSDDNSIVFMRSGECINDIKDESEAFIYTSSSSSNIIKGDSVGRIAFKNRIMDDQYQLIDRAVSWVNLFKRRLSK